MGGIVRQVFSGINSENIKHLLEVQESAPSFGSIVQSLISEQLVGFSNPQIFLGITEITSQFKSLLEDVINGFQGNISRYIFLNVEMGSGKTHFLILLLHLFYTLPRYEQRMLINPVVNKFIGILKGLVNYDIAVSYTHLTLPTTERV